MGEMWVTQALRVVHVTEKGVVLNDETQGAMTALLDLSAVMQFEIDAPFQGFQPHCHYNVKPIPEFR